MPILDEEKRREYQRIYHLKTWSKRKIRHKLLKQKRKRGLDNWLRRYKESRICEICGEDYPACLDFHHTDASDKRGTVSDLVDRGYGRKTILIEIKKCKVLCKNCHAKVHDHKT